MPQSLMTAHYRNQDVAIDVATRISHAMPGDPLKLLLMDDNTFDRRTITRLAKKSRFSLELIEATSIADAEARIAEDKPDLVYLDYRVPDGDGISFSERLTQSMNGTAPPVVIITGEGDERTAIRSLRSGVADYLSKDQLSIENFDSSIERCLAARPVNKSDLMNEVGRIGRQLASLRDSTRRNMHMARAFLIPMAEYAWRSVKALEGDDRRREATRLMKITQRLTGLLDDTLIHSADDADGGTRALVDVHALLTDMLAHAPELADFIKVGDPARFPEIAGNRPQILMLLKELIGEALSSVPPDRPPHVTIDCAIDPKGNPVLCVTDNGDGLAERKKGLADYADGVGHSLVTAPGRATRLSLCQRLAEMNGGQLRISAGRDGGCVVMVRFPRSPVERH